MNKQICKETIRIILIFCVVFIILCGITFVSTFKTRGITNLLTAGLLKEKINIISTSNLEVKDNEYKTLDKSSWIVIKNKSNNRLIFDIDFKTQTNIGGAIYYADTTEQLTEEQKMGFTLKPGKNLIEIDQNVKDQILRVDFHTGEDFEFKINSITSEPIIYSFLKEDVLNNVMFFIITIILTILVEAFIKTQNKETKIDIVYWIILLVSLIFVFSRFIVGEAFYLYSDSGQDTINQYYPYFVNEAMNIKNGTFDVWNFDYGLGTCLLNTNAWTFDIFAMVLVLLGIIFGIGKMHFLLVYMQILKIIVVYILTKKYLSYFLKDKNSICLAAYLSSFSGYIVLWGQHYFLGTSCFYIILMLCVIENILAKKSKSGFAFLALSVASLLIFSFYIGYMVLLASALYYIYRYIKINEKVQFKTLVGDFSKCLFSVITGFLLAGIIFVPSCYNVLTTSSRLDNAGNNVISRCILAFTESFSLSTFNQISSRLISNNLYLDGSTSSFYGVIQVFCTIFIAFFIIQFFIYEFKIAKTKKDYIFFAIKIFFLFIMIFNELAGLVFNAFAYPAYRYSYIIFPFFGIIIGTVFENVISKKSINLVGLILSTIFSIYIWIYSYNVLNEDNIKYSLIILAELIIGFVILYVMKFDPKHIRIYTAIFIGTIIISTSLDHYVTTNFRGIVDKNDYQLIWNKSELVDDTTKAVNWIKENDKSFYRIELRYGIFSTLGDSFLEKISTLTYYNSTINPNIAEFYSKIYPRSLTAMDSIKIFTLQDEADLQALYVTNSKYILAKGKIELPSLKEIKKIGGVYIYENTDTNSVAKFFTQTITSDEYENKEESIKKEILYTNAIVDDFKVDLDENATAHVGKFYLKGQTYLYGDITSDGQGLVMLGIPYQEGWDVYIDGKLVEEKYKVDYGFIGIIVPEGSHKVELKYELPKLNIGIISTIFGIVCFGVIEICSRKTKIIHNMGTKE